MGLLKGDTRSLDNSSYFQSLDNSSYIQIEHGIAQYPNGSLCTPYLLDFRGTIALNPNYCSSFQGSALSSLTRRDVDWVQRPEVLTSS